MTASSPSACRERRRFLSNLPNQPSLASLSGLGSTQVGWGMFSGSAALRGRGIGTGCHICIHSRRWSSVSTGRSTRSGPRRAAMRSCSALTVGSSPKTSSPSGRPLCAVRYVSWLRYRAANLPGTTSAPATPPGAYGVVPPSEVPVTPVAERQWTFKSTADDEQVILADGHDAAEEQAGEVAPGVGLLHERDARGEHHREHDADRAVLAGALARGEPGGAGGGEQGRGEGAEVRRDAEEEGADDARQDGVGEGGAHEGHAAQHHVGAEAGAGRAAQRDGGERAHEERLAQRFGQDLKHGDGRGPSRRDA